MPPRRPLPQHTRRPLSTASFFTAAPPCWSGQALSCPRSPRAPAFVRRYRGDFAPARAEAARAWSDRLARRHGRAPPPRDGTITVGHVSPNGERCHHQRNFRFSPVRRRVLMRAGLRRGTALCCTDSVTRRCPRCLVPPVFPLNPPSSPVAAPRQRSNGPISIQPHASPPRT